METVNLTHTNGGVITKVENLFKKYSIPREYYKRSMHSLEGAQGTYHEFEYDLEGVQDSVEDEDFYDELEDLCVRYSL